MFISFNVNYLLLSKHIILLLVALLLSSTIAAQTNNLAINGGVEDIRVKTFNIHGFIDGVHFDYEATDTCFLWHLVSKDLAGLNAVGWNYDTVGMQYFTGYQSRIGLSHSGLNLNLIEVYHTWSKGG